MAIYSPKSGAVEAFSDGSWKNYKQVGPLGKIRWEKWHAATIAAHAGGNRGSSREWVVVPAVSSSTVPADTCDELAKRFADPIVFGREGKIYARLGDVTVFELECALTGMHKCGDTMVFASGMAAIKATIDTLINSGDNIVIHKNVYGCTDDLFRLQYPAHNGVEARFVDLRVESEIKAAIDEKTRAVFFETPSNPALDIIYMRKVADAVGGRCPIIVDNTFASPYGQKPFLHGANIVIYSLTKSIAGHADAIGGAVLGSGAFLAHMFPVRKDSGGIMVGREAYSILNGMKTLRERYRKMQKNARTVVGFLQGNEKVSKVIYPELIEGYPFDGQMKGPGYMVAFELTSGLEGGKALIDNLKLITNAVSLGGVESLIAHPASTTHACVPVEIRQEKGITDGLIRLSVGIEDIRDIINDLTRAFAAVQ